MIKSIRNQPFCLGDNLDPRTIARGCECEEEPVASWIAMTDEVWAQAYMGICYVSGVPVDVVIEGGPTLWTDWVGDPGWFIDGSGFYDQTGTTSASYLTYTPDVIVPGETYSISVTVSNVYPITAGGASGSGITNVLIGGMSFPITADGTYEFTVPVASANGGISFELTPLSHITIESVIVVGSDKDVTALFHFNGTVAIFDRDDFPQYFSFANGNVTLHIPVSAIGVSENDCFRLELVSNCNDTSITSQDFMVISGTDCKSLVIRACNDSDNIGFVNPFVPRIRISARMGWPAYKATVKEERHSNGEIFRPYADRTLTLTVKTGILNEFDHAFLSTLPLWDHVYIEGQEFVVSDGKYEPVYGEDQWLNGAVTFEVTPKAELVRKVACGPAGTGCDPDNDPICFEPQMYFAFVATGSGIELQVTLVSSYNFTPGNASLSVNGSAPIIQTFTLPTPSSLRWSGLEAGQQLIFIFQDMANSNCVITKFFDVPEVVGFDCSSVGVMVDFAGDRGLFVNTTTGYYTIQAQSDSSIATFEAGSSSPAEGQYCVYASDDAGSPSGTITAFGAVGVVDYDISNLSGLTLTDFELDGIISGPFPAMIVTGGTTTITVRAGSDTTIDVSLVAPQQLTVIDTTASVNDVIINSSIMDLLAITDTVLTQLSIELITNSLVASGLSSGGLSITGAGNASPSSASLADKTILEGLGWSVILPA